MAIVKRTENVMVRFSPDEMAMVEKAAKAEGLPPALYVRACVIRVRAFEADPVAWAVIRKNVAEIFGELLQPAARRKLA